MRQLSVLGSKRLSPRAPRSTCIAFATLLLLPAVAVANTAPVAADVSATVRPEASVTVTLSATDADGDTLDYIITALPTGGTTKVGGVAITSGDLPYTIPGNGKTVDFVAAAGEHGDVTLSYKANDGTVDSSAAAATILINQLPTATAATVYTEPDAQLKITLTGSDADADTLTFRIETLPGHGVLSVSSTTLTTSDLPYSLSAADITYTPDESFGGSDSFTFKAYDTYELSTSAATLTVKVNTAPTVESFTTYVQPETPTSITLVGADADRDTISLVILSLPANGVLEAGTKSLAAGDLPYTLPNNGTTVTYTPNTGHLGTDSFHYEAADGVQTSSLGVVSIVVNSLPAGDDATLVTDTAGRATLTLAPTDADGDDVTVTFVTVPTHGSLTADGTAISEDGDTATPTSGEIALVYEVDYDFSGTDSFTWQASDGKDTTGTFTVTITVPFAIPTPETPPAADDPTADDTSSEDTSDLVNPEVDPCGATGEVAATTMVLLTGFSAFWGPRLGRRCRNQRSRKIV